MAIKLIDTYSGGAFAPAIWQAEGYAGVLLKAGQGEWADCPRYKPEWWKQCDDFGLKRGWYWVSDSRYPAEHHVAEMQKWNLFADLGDFPLWIDVEKPRITMTEKEYWSTPYCGPSSVVELIKRLRDLGVRVGFYTAPGVFDLIFGKATQEQKDYVAEVPLWSAQYPYAYSEGISKPSLYGSWKDWTLWQYREGPDINVFNGSWDEFVAFTNNTTTVPDDEVVVIENPPDTILHPTRYTVNVDNLNIRPTPATTSSALRKLNKGTIINGVGDISSDGKWAKIEYEGIVGWCYLSYLTLIPEVETGDIPVDVGESVNIKYLFDNIDVVYTEVALTNPRNVIYHLLELDLKKIDLVFDSNPRGVASTTHFLEKTGCDLAINGDGFVTVKKGGKTTTESTGFWSYHGAGYGPAGNEQTIYLDENNNPSLVKPKTIWNAFSFPNILVKDGIIQPINKSPDDIRARTAVGFDTKNGKLFLFVCDGKDYYSRDGLNLQETATIMKEIGCDIAVLNDSGGSTTMTMKGDTGAALLLNVPCGEGRDGQRPVWTHFGIKVKTS